MKSVRWDRDQKIRREQAGGDNVFLPTHSDLSVLDL